MSKTASHSAQTTPHHTLPLAVAATIVTIIALMGVWAWIAEGDTLFVKLVQTGLAWCL